MSSTQHQLIEQCATRLRGIVEALDNIHDTSPHRWSTDLDDVHSSAESLLALIKDQAPTQAAQGLAGAALAQPSPASVCATPAGENCPGDGVKSCKKCPEQPEAERLRKAYEWGYEDGQNNPNGYSDKKERDTCVNELLKQPSLVQAEAHQPTYECTMGVGGGDGNLFVHGDHASIKAAQQIVLERDAALARVEQQERTIAGINEAHAKLAGLYEAAQAQHSLPEGWMLVECGIWTQEQVDEMQKTVARFRNSEFVDDRALAMAVADAGQCKAPEISLAELLAAAPGKEVPQAWIDVQAERCRQITAEGWTPEHDDEHSHGQMARAAACYALAGSSAPNDGTAALLVSLAWPWDEQWWKPSTARRDLVKACALALAEIERLDRAGISQSPQPGATTASS